MREYHFLPERRRGPGSWFPPLPALPAGEFSRFCLLERNLEHSLTGSHFDRRRGADESAVDGLAERLGVGERQLRRLFQQHLGVSPLAVAQTRRVLFAKQLIADTRMPLAEVAFASGFGSVRRFNTTFHQLFRTPAARAAAHHVQAEGEAPAAAGIVITLPFAQPYDWNAMLSLLSRRERFRESR